jgi:hypothetical protein
MYKRRRRMMLLNIGADLYYWQIVINHVIVDAICSLVPHAFSIYISFVAVCTTENDQMHK